VDGIAGIFRDQRSEKRGTHAGVKILAYFEGHFDFFGEGKRNVLGDLVVAGVDVRKRLEVRRSSFSWGFDLDSCGEKGLG